MRKIHLFWWRDRDNVGDAASRVVVEWVSQSVAIWTPLSSPSFMKDLKVFKKNLVHLKLSWPFHSIIDYIHNGRIFAIGSIMNRVCKNTVVWGAGFREFDNELSDGVVIKAIRGRLSLDICARKIDVNNIKLGDPGLLISKVYPIHETIERKQLCLIPHYNDLDDIRELYGNKYDILDVRTTNVKQFVEDLCKYKYVLSSSLHGLIFAHSYGIPAIWVKHNYVNSSDFKYYDYFSAVGINEYEGFDFIEVLNSNSIIHFFESHESISTIDKEKLYSIQQDLIDCFPYDCVHWY